ncbi:MAG: amidohydrolase [Clostridia bacterium]|nr:amidohydrolase [Clostridia bacterium]
MIIDFHTHFFPDKIAEKAMAVLAESAKTAKIFPQSKATLEDNLQYMKNSGIDKMVALNIAVVPKQEKSINEFVINIKHPDIIAFGSVHPDSKSWEDELNKLVAYGIRGVKFHPEYQQVDADDSRWYPIYEFCTYHNLIMSVHCGYDVAYPETRRATPKMMARLSGHFKGSKFVCAHFGGMLMWDEVFNELAGKAVYIDTSMCDGWLELELAKKIVNKHGAENVLFGSDLPWGSAVNNIKYIEQLNLGTQATLAILGDNAERLLKRS